MSELFLSVLNMSLTASYVIIFVIVIRLLLKKAPKFISYALWGVVAFRLIIPFSFESMFSLFPRGTNTVPIPHDIIYQQSPQIDSGIEVIDSLVNQSLPAPAIGASVNPLQIYVEIGAYIWILGIIALLVYSLVSVLILKRQLKSARLIEQNIFEAKNLKTPFVLGLIRPKIYLPVGLNASEKSYILLHEQTHIHRTDHIIKILAFLILSIHWFNPLVWIAFILMSADMELSCDEKVLKEMNEDIKKPYANSLLSLATGRHILNGSPLAFGEGNVKGRIKNVLGYKKPRFWVIVFPIIIVLALGIGLIANPKYYKTNELEQIKLSLTPEVENIISANYINDMKCTNEDIEKIIEYAETYGIKNPYIPTVGVGTDYIMEIRKDTEWLTIVYPHFAITESTNEILPSSDNIRRETANLSIGDGEWWIDISGNTRELHLHLDDIYIRIFSAKSLGEKEYEKIAESLVYIKSQP